MIFYAQPPVGCLGGEAVYFLHLQDPTMYGVNLIYDPHGPVTPVVVLLSMCDELFGFILTSGAGWQTNYPVTGGFYIVVDSFQAPGTPYQLLFWVTGPSAVPLDTPPPGNQVSTWGVIKAAYR